MNNFKLKYPIVLDVSHWEGVIEWSLVFPKPAGVICKASQGISYVDPTASHNWAGLEANGIRRGLYHYLEPKVQKYHKMTQRAFILAQAENFIKVCTILGIGSSDIIALDLEEKGMSADDVLAWLDRVESALHKRPLIYTRRDIWLSICDWLGRPPKWVSGYGLWVAQYPYEPDKWSKPSLIPPGWTVWKLWQYAETAFLEGIASEVDADVPTAFFAAEWGLPDQPPPIIPEPRIHGNVIAPRGVRIRTLPSALSVQIGVLKKGDPITAYSVKVVSSGEEWIQLHPIGWAAARYGGEQLIDYVKLPL